MKRFVRNRHICLIIITHADRRVTHVERKQEYTLAEFQKENKMPLSQSFRGV